MSLGTHHGNMLQINIVCLTSLWVLHHVGRTLLFSHTSYMADPTAVQMEGFGILFIPLSANFSWMSVSVIIIATTRIMYA